MGLGQQDYDFHSHHLTEGLVLSSTQHVFLTDGRLLGTLQLLSNCADPQHYSPASEQLYVRHYASSALCAARSHEKGAKMMGGPQPSKTLWKQNNGFHRAFLSYAAGPDRGCQWRQELHQNLEPTVAIILISESQSACMRLCEKTRLLNLTSSDTHTALDMQNVFWCVGRCQ